MKKTTKFVAATVVIGVAGVGASLFLIPEESNIQQMQVRDDALRSATFVDYEQKYVSGERTKETVLGYAEQLISLDRASAALPVLNEYLQSNPNDVEARRKLARVHQFTGNTEAYVQELQWLALNTNDPDSLRLLSDYYNGKGDLENQVAVLKQLLEATGGNEPKVFVDLATIQTALGDKAGASETLGLLVQKHPTHMDFGTLRLYVLALLDQGDSDRAMQYAGRWVSDNFNADELADLANAMHYNASAQTALTLMQPYANSVTSNDNLLAAYVNALVNAGQPEQAYELLKQHAAVKPLNKELLTAYMPLALEYGTTEEALRVVQNINPRDFTEAQAIEMIRLAKQQESTELSEQVVIEFIDEEYLYGKPVLDAIITLDGQNQQAANAKIAEAIASPTITSELRIQLANACAEAGNSDCVESILASLPPIDQMTPAMLANTADLYMSLDRVAEIYEPVSAYRTAQPSGVVDQIWLRLVAANGDKATMQEWLAANPQATTATNLRDLYYTAANHDHYQTAAVVAEHLNTIAQSNEHEAMLVNAYLRTYQYSKALPYLRQNKDGSAQVESDYITALEVLAKRDKESRKELVGYIQDKLANGGLSQSETRRYAYILINNGRKDIARPLVAANAKAHGGEWKKMLAQLDGEGGTAKDPIRSLSPEERVAKASEAGMSREKRREIAFGLKEDGYQDEALHIFNRLASAAQPGSEDVNDLLYLLEQRNPRDALTWMDARRRNATSEAERMAWSKMIADKSDPYAYMALISSDPSLLTVPTLRDRYFYALAEHGSEAEYTQAMKPWIGATNDVDGLIKYARIAEGQGYRQAAVNAYQRANQLDGNNLDALHDLGVSAFLQANYSEANRYLDRYFAVRNQNPSAGGNPYLAAFYKAELLRRDGQKEEAQKYFAQSFEGARVLREQSVGSQSIMYTSLFHLGRANDAIAGFRTLLASFPKNRTLLADYMTVLIEYKYYDEAQRVANQYDYAPAQQANGTPYSYLNGEVVYFEFIPVNQQVASFQQTDETLRLQLLYARIELENGDREAALNRLRIMQQYYPNNPELMGYTASIESAGGNYNRALQLLNKAQSLTPQNEDLAQLKKNIQKVHGQHVKLDHEWRRIGNSDEQISTFSGMASIDATTEIGIVAQNDEVDGSQVRRTRDGAIVDSEHSKQRGQIYLNSYTDAGSRHQFSLFGNSSDVGAGYAYAFNNSIGRTDIIVDWHRPYWDFTQAVIEDANRDRVGFTHMAQLSDTVSFFGETSVNRYNLQDEADAASSYLLRMSFVKRIRDAQPYVGIGYGFDGEYMIDKQYRNTAAGVRYGAFDLTAREIHFLSAIFQHAFTSSLTGDLVAGYAVDRLGDHGPSVEAKLTQELTDEVEIQARARYGLETNNTDDNASTVGGHLLWRY